MTHPKIVGLSDKAFRLWIWGLSYSQQHLTDGLIPSVAIPARVSRATADLLEKRLWEKAGADYQVHDYLDWNDSREFVNKKRTDAKERMAAARERSTQSVRANNSRTSPEVLRRVGLRTEDLKEEKVTAPPSSLIVTDEIAHRAARFLGRFDQLYSQYRHGAKHLRKAPALDHDRACQLCQTWESERLEKMAVILFTTNEEWVEKTDRGFGVFFSKATWCDERLAAWEAQQRKPA